MFILWLIVYSRTDFRPHRDPLNQYALCCYIVLLRILAIYPMFAGIENSYCKKLMNEYYEDDLYFMLLIMYSTQQLIAGITNEFNILKHLGSKVNEANYTHKLTDPQRTIQELEHYIISSFPGIPIIKLIPAVPRRVNRLSISS